MSAGDCFLVSVPSALKAIHADPRSGGRSTGVGSWRTATTGPEFLINEQFYSVLPLYVVLSSVEG